MSEHWVLGANDNNWVGWGITVAYLIVAGLCFVCGRRIEPSLHDSTGRERWLWWFVGTMTLLLGINKQLDLQTPLCALGRAMAEAEGWYRYRRIVQAWFVAAIASLVLGVLFTMGFEIRRQWRKHLLLYAGVVILAGFIVLRVATFQHVRESVKWSSPIHGTRYAMEAFGIICIGLSALMTLSRSFRHRIV